VDRRRPAVPRKLAKPAEMGFSGRSSVDKKKTRKFRITLD
jgi:hypothetical protein